MDSYEYYLLYHKNSSDFILALSDNNSEGLVALEALLKNKKIQFASERVSCFEALFGQLQRDNEENKRLDRIFEDILTVELFDSFVKFWIMKSCRDIYDRSKDIDRNVKINVFRVARIVIVKRMATKVFLNELTLKLLDICYIETKCHHEIVNLLHLLLHESDEIRETILSSVFARSKIGVDSISTQILIYFFDEICQQQQFAMCDCDFLIKFFQDSNVTSRKNGLFLINRLVHHNKFEKNDEDSFKSFSIIVESLSENQSHLILPTLELMKGIRFSNHFKNFWFVACQLIFKHDNTLVKKWGLNYILSACDVQFNDNQMIMILAALNESPFFDSDAIPARSLQHFVQENLSTIFKNLIEINWKSVPFYCILKYITECFTVQQDNFDCDYILTLHQQTEIIPRRIKNLVIRSGVQKLYATISSCFLQHVGIQPLLPIFINIFFMGKNQRSLEVFIDKTAPQEMINAVIFINDCPDDFIRFVLLAIHKRNPLTDLENIFSKLKKNKKLRMQLLAEFYKMQHYFESELVSNISETIEAISTDIDSGDNKMMVENLELLEIGLTAKNYTVDLETQKLILNVWKKIFEVAAPVDWKLLKFILLSRIKIDISNIEGVIFELNPRLDNDLLHCLYLILQLQSKYATICDESCKSFLKYFESFVDECYHYEDLNLVLRLLECFSDEILCDTWIIHHSLLTKISDLFMNSDERGRTITKFISIMLKSTIKVSQSNQFNEHITQTLEALMPKLNYIEKANVLHIILELMKTSDLLDHPSTIQNFAKKLMLEKILETEMMTNEQQIEFVISSQIESDEIEMKGNNELSIKETHRLRMTAARIFSAKFNDEFPGIIENYMEAFSKASKKKPRYFPNSWIHRMKLHYLQPLVFCSEISKRTVNILLDELFNVNNQLNVTYLIEIILARHHPGMVEVLKDESIVSKLKAPAVKSIFSVAIMQLKIEDAFTLLEEKFFGIAEMRLETLHDIIMPYICFQNYGVRSYAQAAIILMYKHVKSQFGARKSIVMSRIASSCSIIEESMKFKNAARFYEALKQDFRFTLKFSQILSAETFYHHIPFATKMPPEEIISCEDEASVDCSRFKVAENADESNTHVVVSEELSVSTPEESNSNSLNFQQKYLPYKYQVPVDKLIRLMPSFFKLDDNDEEFRKNIQSELIVIASLISRAPNLGGLARTCEIFAVENYVIESLKIIENPDFKALSKTAEKWMKISEIKTWQLSDFLLGMKKQGYSIVGAEQTGTSVSLAQTKIPKKCILLLGNEKEGIPANLLSLLDITVEVPQLGVVRSLNVHVTGSLIIWEYAKQHLVKWEA